MLSSPPSVAIFSEVSCSHTLVLVVSFLKKLISRGICDSNQWDHVLVTDLGRNINRNVMKIKSILINLFINIKNMNFNPINFLFKKKILDHLHFNLAT